MMYEELIKRLKAECTLPYASVQLMREAADAIEDLEGKHFMIKKTAEWLAERVPKWIPVTERLPKEMVLAHGRNGDIRLLEYSFAKKWWEDDDGYYCGTNYVTHWMPLPEPPKEET